MKICSAKSNVMDDNILLYDIQAGETLEIIGHKFGMTSDELKDFHNAHCNKMDRLWFTNLTGVNNIIVPKSYKNPEQIKAERTKELPSSSVSSDFYADTYLVEESYSGILLNSFQLAYKIQISFRNKKEYDDPFEIADIYTYDFLKNGSNPDDKMSSIALACMESIFPISFTIPIHGRISGFYEFENLKKRFEEKRGDLEEFFVGDVYRAYLNKFSVNLIKKDYVLNLLSSSLLYQILFPKMDWFHRTEHWTEQFYFLSNSMLLKCAMFATYNHAEKDFVETRLKGVLKELFSLQEILRRQPFDDRCQELEDAEINLLYKTDKKTKKMIEAEASIIFRKDSEIFREQTLKLTQNG